MNERKILEKSIEQHQAAIDEAKGKLADLDKPKLRHGDYGYSGSSDFPRIYLKDKKGEVELASAGYIFKHDNDADLPTIILGNIFDDLERNSKDLREFAVEWSGGYRFSAKLLDDSCGHKHRGAKIEIVSGGSCYAFEKIVEIHQKLGQLIAAAEREKNDC